MYVSLVSVSKCLAHNHCQPSVCSVRPKGTAGVSIHWSCWLLACLTSQQHASVSQGRICTDNFTCCHTEIKLADQTFYLTQSQYTDTGPTSPRVDPLMPGAWQDSHWSANFSVTGMTRPGKIPSQARFEPGIFRPEADALTTRPMRRYPVERCDSAVPYQQGIQQQRPLAYYYSPSCLPCQ